MTIEIRASDDGWVEVNGRPVTVRGDEATTRAKKTLKVVP